MSKLPPNYDFAARHLTHNDERTLAAMDGETIAAAMQQLFDRTNDRILTVRDYASQQEDRALNETVIATYQLFWMALLSGNPLWSVAIGDHHVTWDAHGSHALRHLASMFGADPDELESIELLCQDLSREWVPVNQARQALRRNGGARARLKQLRDIAEQSDD